VVVADEPKRDTGRLALAGANEIRAIEPPGGSYLSTAGRAGAFYIESRTARDRVSDPRTGHCRVHRGSQRGWWKRPAPFARRFSILGAAAALWRKCDKQRASGAEEGDR
jgi:hypothetical protein